MARPFEELDSKYGSAGTAQPASPCLNDGRCGVNLSSVPVLAPFQTLPAVAGELIEVSPLVSYQGEGLEAYKKKKLEVQPALLIE